MKPNEYQRLAMRTADANCRCFSNVGLGLAGEAGEVADMIKKNMFQGHIFDLEAYIKELGDVIWYSALGCEVAGIDLETVMELNIEKLRERYPDGFDPERSRNREE